MDDFIAKSVLLTGLYFVVGSVFQQAYLRAFGLHVGLFDISSIIPRFADPLVVAYSIVVWATLTRIPDRWYNHVAELANPTTWRNPLDLSLRCLPWVFFFVLLVIGNLLETRVTQYPPDLAQLLVPTFSFFSSPYAFWGCVAMAPLIAVLYFVYAQVRRQLLDEIWSRNRRFIRATFHVFVPLTLIYSMLAFGLVFPSNYGRFKAGLDMSRMKFTGLGQVDQIVTSSLSCIPVSVITSTLPIASSGSASGVLTTTLSSEDFYIYDLNNIRTTPATRSVHYFGAYGGNMLFFVIPEDETAPAAMCLVSQEAVKSIRLTHSD